MTGLSTGHCSHLFPHGRQKEMFFNFSLTDVLVFKLCVVAPILQTSSPLLSVLELKGSSGYHGNLNSDFGGLFAG